ncbi:MAG: putative ATPase [Chthonomonadaceae bacterium]|nr:putative ATPase [Chthonomonadaceae bacterium]
MLWRLPLNLPAGTVTFLFTDIENSSSLWETQPEAMAVALTRHNDLLRQVIEANKGVVFKTVGDAFYTVFASPLDALNATIEAQGRLAAEPWDEFGIPLKVRMGVHVGAPECREGDYFGPSVNRVARVCDLGHGGQILITRAVHELIGETAPQQISFRSLNAWRLKGMARPETIYQVEAPNLPTDFPSLRSVAESVGNLPEILASFVGREPEMRQIAHRLDGQKLLTLRGAGGCGKTRLAIEATRPLAVDYPGGVWLVRLDALHDPDLIAREVARTLRLYIPAEQTIEQALAARLTEQSTLLILDNCEHLRNACARFAHELLANCHDLRILATSREPLGVPGEYVSEVPPLRLPKRSEKPSLAVLRASEAVQLFTARAEAGSGFTLTRENAAAVSEICRALDGIPLALELAARWVGTLPLEDIARELGELINEPSDDQDLVPLRQQTMRATVDWSFNQLDPDSQALFLNLAVFVGGFTLEAARAMNPGEGASTTHVLRLLKGLVAKSFVLFDEKALPDPRYRLLEPVREVAVEKLLLMEGESAARDQHRDWFFTYALRAEPELQGTQQTLWVGRLEADQDNFRAALKWSVDPKTRLRFAMALHRFWLIRQLTREGRAWLEGAFAQAIGIEDAERAKILNVLGIFAWTQSEIETAKRYYAESLAIYQRLNLLADTTKVLNNMAVVAKHEGDFELAALFYQQCLTIYRDLKDNRGICILLNNLGGLLCDAGDHAGALPLLEESLQIHQACSDEAGEATTLYNLGDLALSCRQIDVSEKRFTESLRIFWKLGEGKSIVRTLIGLAAVYSASQRFACAARLLSTGQFAAERSGVPLSPTTQVRFDKTIEAVKEGLSEDQFELAWHEGQTANPADVVAGLLGTGPDLP